MRESIKSVFRPLYHSYLSVRYRGRARKSSGYAEHHRKLNRRIVLLDTSQACRCPR